MESERIMQALERAEMMGLDGLALMPGPNLRYLTGLSLVVSERPIVVFFPVDAEACAVVPGFEAAKLRDLGVRAFDYGDEEGYALAFHEACVHLELADARLGVEALRMRLLEARALMRYAPNIELIPADNLYEEQRSVKSVDELNAMQRAVRVAESVFLRWVSQLRVGITEREAAAQLMGLLLSNGADGLAFEPIVASGPNAALPHAVPGDRPFQVGDWVVVDWGAIVDGYVSDLTRVLVVGDPSGPLAKVHTAVVEANEAAYQAVAPGITAEAVDMAARTVIEDHGYGAYFTHRTGHGLGLEAHEMPSIVAGNSQGLLPGMTFTIEPGVYLPGIGGVRIEDDVVVTAQGAMRLSSLSRAPFVVPT